MKRRDFLKATALIPAIGLIPSVVLAKQEYAPKTAKELYDAINSLGMPKNTISKKAYEESLEGRYIHETYLLGHQSPQHDTERLLVKKVWDNMNAVFDAHPNRKPVIYWRRIPEYSVQDVDVNFDNVLKPEKLEPRAYLKMRLSIGTSDEKSNLKSFLVKAEGDRPVYLGRKWND